MKKLLLTLSLTFLASNTSLARDFKSLVESATKALDTKLQFKTFTDPSLSDIIFIEMSVPEKKDRVRLRVVKMQLSFNKKTCRIESVEFRHSHSFSLFT